MNITVNTSLNVITKSVDTIADISREFTDGTRLHEVEEVKDKLSHSIGTQVRPGQLLEVQCRSERRRERAHRHLRYHNRGRRDPDVPAYGGEDRQGPEPALRHG